MINPKEKNSYHSLVNREEVRKAYDALVQPGQIVEIRALEASREKNGRYTETLGGYFDNVEDLIREICTIQRATGIYITLQPCNSQILHRSKNRIVKQKKDYSTPDKYVTQYLWLAIDSDPERVSNISSDEIEHQRALAHSRKIRDVLKEMGWPDPIETDSGNGGHLLYRISLPTSDVKLIDRVLKGLAAKFDEEGIHVDQTLYNPSRIIKLYGTMACKGDNTDERPHRLSHIIRKPDTIELVSRELLEAIAVPEKEEVQPRQQQTEWSQDSLNLEKFMQKHNIQYKTCDNYDGGKRYHLRECAWDSSHTDNSACLYEKSDGRLGASCSHNSCKGKGWREFRLVFEPDAYTTKEVATRQESPKKEDRKEQKGAEKTEEKTESVAKQLLRMAEPIVEVFSDRAGARYARVLHKGHQETMMISDKGSFRRWLHDLYERHTGNIPNSNALLDVIHTFDARAQFRSPRQEEVYIRVAYIEETNTIYLDMANDTHQVIEITENGWKVLDKSPVCFRRSASMAALPTPEVGGSVDDLKEFINVKDEDWILIKSWILGVLQPNGLDFGEYAILNLNGGQGAAKTSAARRVRSVFDPSIAPLRKQPKDDQAFSIMAHNNFVVGLDNLSHISAELSDMMCTLSTGAGDAYRTLYTDAEETVFVAKRPQVFTGIEQLATRGDLLDRCIIVTLLEISDDKRIDSTTLNKKFTDAHPKILGAFLDCASYALKHRSSVQMKKKPRLADFAMFVQAAEPLLTKVPGEFLTAYRANREEGVASELEASPVAAALIKLMEDEGSCVYTATSLLQKLEETTSERITKSRAWPQTPRGLSAQLKRLARSLRAVSIFLDFKSTGTQRNIIISKTEPKDVADAKLEFPDAKLEFPDAKSEPLTQNKSALRQGQSESGSDLGPILTQTDAKIPTSLFEAEEKNIEKVEKEKEERVTSQGEENLRQFASGIPKEHEQTFFRYQESIAHMGEVFWRSPESGYVNGYLASADHIKRVQELLLSGDARKIASALEVMRSKIGIS